MVQPRELFLSTCGGRIRCRRCQAKCKATNQQCKAPAVRGKAVCRVHGGRSTGPRTAEGRQRCADAKTVHGRETRAIRKSRQASLIRMAGLEALGRAKGFITGPKTRGPKPGGKRSS